MNPNTYIRVATVDDIPRMSKLFADSWRVAYRGMINDAFLDSIQDDRWVAPFTEGMKNDSHYFVAEQKDILTGAVCVRKSIMPQYPDDGELAAIYVHPDAFGSGVGTGLLAAAEDYLRAAGYEFCILEVLPQNTRAFEFYLRHQFQKTPHSVDITLGGQHLTNNIMRKKL